MSRNVYPIGVDGATYTVTVSAGVSTLSTDIQASAVNASSEANGTFASVAKYTFQDDLDVDGDLVVGGVITATGDISTSSDCVVGGEVVADTGDFTGAVTANGVDWPWDGHTELSDVAWDDLVITGSDFTNGPSAPSRNTTWVSGTNMIEFAQGDNVYFDGLQMPHKRKVDSDIYYHVHFSPLSDITDGETIIWTLTYTVATVFGKYPATVTATTTFTNDAATRTKISAVDATILSGTTIQASAKPHLVSTSAVISGTDLGHSTILAGELEFDATSTYTGNAIFLSSDAHIQIDRLGSENEFTG